MYKIKGVFSPVITFFIEIKRKKMKKNIFLSIHFNSLKHSFVHLQQDTSLLNT